MRSIFVIWPLTVERKQEPGKLTMAEKGPLIEQDDGHYSEEEALIYISDEKHPSGATRKAEVRR